MIDYLRHLFRRKCLNEGKVMHFCERRRFHRGEHRCICGKEWR